MSDDAQRRKFQALFTTPNQLGQQEAYRRELLAELENMPPKEFSAFVAYVFQRAGYEKTDRAARFAAKADFELARAGQGATPSAAVIAQQVAVNGTVPDNTIARLSKHTLVRKQGQAGFVVTNGGFDKAGYERANKNNLLLLDGEVLCRYIQYVNGSRYDETTGITVCIPPDQFARPSAPAEHRAKILAIANNKGGVGKTTTAYYFAQHLATNGNRVLIVDMDPQANLSEGFLAATTFAPRTGDLSESHIGHYFAGQLPLRRLVRPYGAYVGLIPAHPYLSLVDTGGAGRPDAEMRFARDLAELADRPPSGLEPFDWVILDTPPAISLFTRAALGAADYVIAPARSRPSSLAGIRNMLRSLDTMNTLRHKPVKLLGSVITHWDDDEVSRNTYVRIEEQFDRYHSRIFDHEIPFDATVDKKEGMRTHRAERAYEAVVEEMLTHV